MAIADAWYLNAGDWGLEGEQENGMNESLIGEDRNVYVTESPYQAASFIRSSAKKLRIVFDAANSLFLIGPSTELNHNMMLRAAADAGYYPQYIDEYGDCLFDELLYGIFDDMPVAGCYYFIPGEDWEKLKDSRGNWLTFDGYTDAYSYDFGMLLTKEHGEYRYPLSDRYVYANTPLAKALGKYSEHRLIADALKEDLGGIGDEYAAETDSLGNLLSLGQAEFFKDSLARDKEGRLLALRHTTLSVFSEFDRDVNWFSADFEYAKQYAYPKKDGINYDVYFDCRKPLACGDTDKRCYALFPLTRPFALSKELRIICRNAGISEDEIRPILDEAEKAQPGYDETPDSVGYGLRLFEVVRRKSFIDLLRRSGFDSIKTREGPTHALCFGVFREWADRVKAISNKAPTASRNINEGKPGADDAYHFLPDETNWWQNPEDGSWNPTEMVNGRRARARAGIIIVKDGDEILLGEEEAEPGVFSLPGGAINKGESIEEAGVREAKEECFVNVINSSFAGIAYMTVCDETADWVKEHVPEEERWIDYKTYLVIGEYDGEYEGTVNEQDIDASMESSARFYKIKDVIDEPSFKKEWKQALADFGYIGDGLEEEWDSSRKAYVTENAAEIRSFLFSPKRKVYRVLADTRNGLFMLGDADEVTHFGMLQKAVADGWYPKFAEIKASSQFMLTYLEECQTYLFVQADAEGLSDEDDFYWSDGYTDSYEYDAGILYSRGDFKDSAFAKALGKWNRHLFLHGFIGNKPQLQLREGYSDKMTITENYITAKSIMTAEEGKVLRFVYDPAEKLYIIGAADAYGHRGLLDEAIGEGYCPKFIRTDLAKRITEATRTQLISQSRNAGAYKGDTSRGKNRFERKKYSKVASQVKSYNQIDMNQFFKQDILEVKIPVTGETKEYVVTMKLNGVVAEMARNIKSNQNKFEYRTVLQALTKVFNTTDVYVKCTCDDFRFRFAHWAIANNYSADGTDKDPGPGRGIANPNNDKGRGCKHILLVLNNQDWMMKVASVIHNYVNYAEEHMMKPFQQVIFPKLYGMHIDGAIEAGLVPEDTKLETEKHIIEVINDWAKNRGKYKPGTNRNPVNDKRTAVVKTEAEPQKENQ